MTTFQSSSKSNRLLQSKRYTIADADVKEAYTRVLDLNATEIYTQEGAIPTSSAGLPYSGSDGDLGLITSASSNIARYYYRMLLTPGAVVTSGKYQTWFAITGSNGSDTISPQQIGSGQIVNWISNKYLVANQATRVAENPNPDSVGYNVVVSKGSDDVPANATELSSGKYQFDYKTGIVQFVSTADAPSTTEYLFLSGYAYLGQTLDQYISSGGGGGEGTPGGANTQIQFNSSDTFGGSPRLTFNETTGNTTISGSLTLSGSENSDIFLIKSGSIDVAKVDQNGNFVLVERTGATPTAVGGGIMYSSSAFYVGID